MALLLVRKQQRSSDHLKHHFVSLHSLCVFALSSMVSIMSTGTSIEGPMGVHNIFTYEKQILDTSLECPNMGLLVRSYLLINRESCVIVNGTFFRTPFS